MPKLSYSERFTNVKKYNEAGSYTGLQIVSKLNQKNGQDYKLLDAIDIDWNGAWLSVFNSYINNTDELIEAIDKIGELSDFDWVHEQIDAINESIDTIVSTYVTKKQLNELLAQYQKPITPGDHIRINLDNVLYAYNVISPEEADAKYSTLESLEELADNLSRNYYTKTQTSDLAYEVALYEINDKVIRNADERFNNLEKISNWILSLPDEIMETSSLMQRINRLDEEVGYAYYNPENDTYSYTAGLLNTQHDYHLFKQSVNNRMQIITDKTNEAYNTANISYDLAYTAYTASIETDLLAYSAYNMAYHSVVIIGNPHSYSYFVPLTEEQIELLNENPDALEVYSIRTDNQSGIPLKDYYIQNSGLEYYTYVPEVESTGFYKEIEELDRKTYLAQQSADNALFRLYTRTDGTTYAKLELEPFINDGTNTRTMVLEIDEADIEEEFGYINKEGIITTYSLYNAFSYAFSPEFITNDE